MIKEYLITYEKNERDERYVEITTYQIRIPGLTLFDAVVSKHIKSGAVLVHDSQISASIKLSVRRTDINNVLRGRQKTAGGYTFEYAK